MRQAQFILSFLVSLATVCSAAPAPVTIPLFKPGAIRVLLLSGRNNHDWRTTTPALRKALVDTGRFDVRVEEEPEGITAETLAAYDVIVSDYNGPRWGPVTEKAVADFVRSGKGFVVVHAADYAFGDLPVLGDHHVRTAIRQAPWPEYARMIGGVWTAGPPPTGHARRHVFEVKYVDRDHPIARGLDPTFYVNDELYHRLDMQPNIHVLATAYDDPAQGGTGKDEPILWTVQYGQGRVFHTVLGHDVSAINEPGFQASFTRGAEWAATGNVTLPVAPEKKAQIRVMIVTGGHPHDPAFYAMFDNQDDLAVTVDPHPHAFRDDFRKKFDVLVLYDLVSEIGPAERENLKNFLESGKGLVVIHHAIADYNDWEWWWRDVVEGKYFLKNEPGYPRSQWKEPVELTYEPVGKHPVLDGISVMHFPDEGYKGMWLSTQATPILTVDSPYSDKVVAWVSSYPKSRVVCITPGHGQHAHRDPIYGHLIRNAILWTAGKK